MKKLKIFVPVLSAFFLLYGCGSGSQESASGEGGQEEGQGTEITLAEAPSSPAFSDAMLKMNSPESEAELSEGEVEFSYNVTNYELGAQTPDASDKNLANSGNGQHIHLILNNGPYSAHYEPSFQKDLEEGHYVALSFLSRSYHESIKHPEAAVIRQFNVGDANENVDLNKPLLFYSRPKGTYTGEDTEQVLFDFYVANTKLSEVGNQVRVTVNGDKQFMVDEWKAYVLEGLPMGSNTIKIELVDENGNLVDSPVNSETREITLEEGPA